MPLPTKSVFYLWKFPELSAHVSNYILAQLKSPKQLQHVQHRSSNKIRSKFLKIDFGTISSLYEILLKEFALYSRLYWYNANSITIFSLYTLHIFKVALFSRLVYGGSSWINKVACFLVAVLPLEYDRIQIQIFNDIRFFDGQIYLLNRL